MGSIAGNDHERYLEALKAEQRLLDEALADIRRRRDADELTALRAVHERIDAMEQHLGSVRALRATFHEPAHD